MQKAHIPVHKSTIHTTSPSEHDIVVVLLQVPDDSIMKCENMTDLSGKEFMDPASDKTVRFKKSNFH